MPKLGESIIEATITKWLKKEGDHVAEEEPIVEIATDKVDSEIPSPIEGILIKRFFNEGDIVPVGTVIAHISVNGEDTSEEVRQTDDNVSTNDNIEKKHDLSHEKVPIISSNSDRFYSPLVKNIAKKENIQPSELDSIIGTGKDGRLTKDDLLKYINNRSKKNIETENINIEEKSVSKVPIQQPVLNLSDGDQIVEMDRMRRIIADHMVMSKQTSPHVTSFIEVDMTNIVIWRERIKIQFEKKENEKITYTPIIFEAVAKALKEFPGINASVDKNSIIYRKNINIGMATALPNGNLIVPVIKNAEQKNLLGMTKTINDLANRARNNKLNPDDIQGGTFTITNLGSFGSITGTPVINQPQVAILAIGAIQKKPVVIETPSGDTIGIRHMMILALSYDHRVVDGGMGGLFIKRVKELLENFDINLSI